MILGIVPAIFLLVPVISCPLNKEDDPHICHEQHLDPCPEAPDTNLFIKNAIQTLDMLLDPLQPVDPIRPRVLAQEVAKIIAETGKSPLAEKKVADFLNQKVIPGAPEEELIPAAKGHISTYYSVVDPVYLACHKMDAKTFGLKIFQLADELEYQDATKEGKEAILRRIINESRMKKKGKRQVELGVALSTMKEEPTTENPPDDRNEDFNVTRTE